MSALNDILNASVNKVLGLGLQLNAVTVPVVKRKLPKKGETVDPATQITVCESDKPEPTRFYTFSNNMAIIYLVDITIISPNNRDQITNLDTYCAWREAIRTSFSTVVLPGAPTVIEMRVSPQVFLDRQTISDNYDYQALQVRVKSIERGGL